MSGRFRVGVALAGVVVLTAGGLVAANWATADTRNRTGPQIAPQKQAAKMAVDPLVAETLESELGSDSGVVGSYYDDSGALIVAVSGNRAPRRSPPPSAASCAIPSPARRR